MLLELSCVAHCQEFLVSSFFHLAYLSWHICMWSSKPLMWSGQGEVTVLRLMFRNITPSDSALLTSTIWVVAGLDSILLNHPSFQSLRESKPSWGCDSYLTGIQLHLLNPLDSGMLSLPKKLRLVKNYLWFLGLMSVVSFLMCSVHHDTWGRCTHILEARCLF